MSQTPDGHRRLRAVFDEALLQDPSAREAYVDHACASEPELRSDVMRLLAAHQDARSFLEHPPDLLLSALRSEDHFPGTGRFRVVRRLGAGGMGVVYEVHDGVRDEVVALKTLLRAGAADLYRLKREFRSLADVTHANLVCLYELFVEDDRCFFTMELVNGVSFVDDTRGADRARRFDDRLIHALRQLVDGVSALHRSGKLHRDIKPSNVLVTPEGRVVILDFGLIAELLPQHAGDASHESGGTPAYMSPEEASSTPPSEAGDWYGIGVTLYEALTGTVPFVGSIPDVLLLKRTCDPPAPAAVSPDVPADLSAICGEPEAAWRLHAEQQSMLRRSLMTGVQVIRIESLYLRARVALAMAARYRGSSRFLSIARAGARRIARERMPWSDPIALLLEAGIANLESDSPRTLRYLHDATDRFDRADMNLYAAVARRRIGALQDDAPGRELQRQAEEWMAAQHITNPSAMTRVLAPGFPDVA